MPSPHLRVDAAAAPPNLSDISGSTPPHLSGISGSVPPSPRSYAAPSSTSSFRSAATLQEALQGRRRLSSEDAMGSFLGTGDITDCIIKVVRNFHKIDDPSKDKKKAPLRPGEWKVAATIGIVNSFQNMWKEA